MTTRFAYGSLLSLLACALLAPVAAGAGPVTDPGQILRTATDEVMAVVYAPPVDGRSVAARVQPVMEKFFDFAALTRRSIGPGWRQFTPEQQRRTTALLAELIVRNYCAHFDTKVRSQVTFAAPVPLTDDRCELPTSITYSGQNYSVTYRAEQASGRWRFYDVIAEGVSLVANYRAQFAPLFQKGGAAAIIHALEEKLASPTPTK